MGRRGGESSFKSKRTQTGGGGGGEGGQYERLHIILNYL